MLAPPVRRKARSRKLTPGILVCSGNDCEILVDGSLHSLMCSVINGVTYRLGMYLPSYKGAR
jgi:hypothetical protein